VKPIRLSGHARLRIAQRGTTEREVSDTIRESRWSPAEGRRYECEKDFDFGQEWNGRVYTTKRVRPIFAETPKEILVVTVYVYYF
jgi:hypothetical protein